MKILIILALFFSICPLLSNNKIQKPGQTTDYKISVPDVKIHTIKNGLKFNIIEKRDYPFVLINIYFRGGSSLDLNEPGLSELASDLLINSINASSLGNYLRDNNLILTRKVTPDYISIEFKFLKKHLKTLLPNIANQIQKPNISNDMFKAIAKNRSLIKHKLNEFDLANNLTRNVIFGLSHNYSFQNINSDNITFTSIKSYVEKFFTPDNSFITMQGDFKTKEIIKQLETSFGNWQQRPKTDIQIQDISPLPKGIHFVSISDKLDETYVCYAYHAPSKSEPEYELLKTVLEILTAEDRGLLSKQLRNSINSISEIRGYISNYLYSNYILLTIKCNKNDIERVVRTTKEILKSLSKKLPEIEILTSAQRYLSGEIILSFDKPSKFSELLYNANLLNTSIDYYKNLPLKLRTESAYSILRVYQKYFGSDIDWILVLGSNEIVEKLEKFSNVFYYDNKLNPITTYYAKYDKSSISPQTLITRYNNKIAKNLSDITTLEKSGQVTMHNPDKPESTGFISIKHKSPDKMYQNIEIGDMHQELWVNGTKSWIKFGPNIEEETDIINESSVLMSKLFPVANLLDLGYKCEVLGIQQNFIVMRATSPLGRTIYHYFDKENYLLTRTDALVDDNINSFVITTEFKIYSDFEGYLFPQKIIEKSPYFSMIYDLTYKINSEISDTTFLPYSTD